MKVELIGVVWVLFLSTILIVGCYYWYIRSPNDISRVFSVVVPVIVIPIWGMTLYAVVNEKKTDEGFGGRRKRKLR